MNTKIPADSSFTSDREPYWIRLKLCHLVICLILSTAACQMILKSVPGGLSAITELMSPKTLALQETGHLNPR